MSQSGPNMAEWQIIDLTYCFIFHVLAFEKILRKFTNNILFSLVA